MSEVLPTIWVNVTTSANWQRPPVGIVRVEQSLTTELEKLYGERLKLCVWQNGQFIEYSSRLAANQQDAKTTESNLTKAVTVDALPKDQNLPWMFPILSRREALRATTQGVMSLLPNKLRGYFNRFLYYIRPRLSKLRISKLFFQLKNNSHSKSSKLIVNKTNSASGESSLLESGSSCLFSPNDVLISVGLDWDNSFYKEFYSLRKKHQVKVVTCCYDLIPVIYPQYCVNDVARLFMSYFLEIADGSDLVMCISKQSEKDFLHMLDSTGGAKPKTHVYPLGHNVAIANAEEISAPVKNICKDPFILFVSTIERRKNHEVLYRAYHLLCAEGKREQLPKLLFVGMEGWGVGDLLKDIELDPLTRDLIVRLNHVTDAELRVLYDHTEFCVFPSLYEGWGLPIGEALSLGKAILSSDRGSLPEVGGDLVRYVNPWSPKDWAEEIYRMIDDEAWRLDWERKVKANYIAKTWQDTALSVRQAIESI